MLVELTMTRMDSAARLRVAMAGYPDHLDPDVREFLCRLVWRRRRAVELVYGRGLTQEEAGRVLCVSRRTIGRDLAEVCRLFDA